MSINFIPDAGTWTGYKYYTADLDDIQEGDDVRHGMRRTEDEYPTVDCHNSGGYMVMRMLGLPDDACCGEAKAEQVSGLLERATEQLRMRYEAGMFPEDYEVRKLHAMLEMLRHCAYHQCGFTWG